MVYIDGMVDYSGFVRAEYCRGKLDGRADLGFVRFEYCCMW